MTIASFMIIPVGYLLGSIPFGLILTKMAGLGDIRDIGSGNIGATNVLRTGNKKIAAATLLLDMLKGTLAVVLARILAPQFLQYAALAAFLGHLFPIWLKFKGGKGVATAIGITLALAWPVGFAVILTWIATAKLFKYSSLAALVALGTSPIYMYFYGSYNLVILMIGIALLVLYKHRENIERLYKGTESKIGQYGKRERPSE